MKQITGIKDLVDRIVINGPPDDSKVIGFSKCQTTGEYIYKKGVVTLCEDCEKCKQSEAIIKKFGGTDVPNTN